MGRVDLSTPRPKISDARALIVGSHFEAAAGARGVLPKDQGNVLARQMRRFEAGRFCSLKLGDYTQEIANVLR
jgi:hypothetical protein